MQPNGPLPDQVNIKKGCRIRAGWLQVDPAASLAGMQPKFAMTSKTVEGVVTHVRGDHPTHPTMIRIWVQPDEGPEVIVKPEHVLEILSSE